MTLVFLLLLQWLHILAGTVLMGGVLVGSFLLPRAMLDKPSAAARAVYDPFSRMLGPLMGAAGMTVMLAGILRGTLFGPLQSFAAFVTPYGITWLVALVLTGIMAGRSRRWARRLPELIWDGELRRPRARALVQQNAFIALAIFTAILVCMVLLRFGL